MFGGVGFTVFLDANVLYSRTLRDWVLLLALLPEPELYRVRWSEDVLVEALYHLRRAHPEWNSGRIEAVRRMVETSFGECRVSGFDPVLTPPGLDPHDRHVHAAAVACGADIVVTDDLAYLTWWQRNAATLSYEAHSADSFLCLVDDLAPTAVVECSAEQQAYWQRVPAAASLPAALHEAGAPVFAERVMKHLSSTT